MEILSAARSAGGNEIPAALLHVNHIVTRAAFDALVAAVNLSPGEIYLIEDENRLLCATTFESYFDLPAWPPDAVSEFPVSGLNVAQTSLFTGYPALALTDGDAYTPYQRNLGVRRFAGWDALAGSTSVSTFGIASPTVTGSATSRSIASTNVFTRTQRTGYVSAVSAGSSAGARRNTGQWYRSVANGLGGFTAFFRFGISDASPVTGGRVFVGLYATTSAIGNVEPSTLTNIIGIGADTGDNNMQLLHNDSSGTATKVDLGAAFPARNLTDGLYDLVLYAPQDDASYMDVKVFYAAGDGSTSYIENRVSTNLPDSSQSLTCHFWRNNGANAAAVGIDMARLFVEQPK